MRILVVIPSYKPAYVYGGPVRSVAALCEALVEHGNEVTVMTTNANGKENLDVKTRDEVIVDGVHVCYFNRWTRDHSNFTPSLLRTFWRQCKSYDIVHIQSWWNLVAIPILLLCSLQRITPILSPRGSITMYTMMHQKAGIKKLFHNLFGKRLLKKAVMHVTALQEQEDIQQLLAPKAVHIIPNILSLPSLIHILNRDEGQFKLLYLGRIDPKKNIELLLDIVMHDFSIPYSLEIIGDGDPVYIETLKNKSVGNNRIVWSDPVHSAIKWEKLAAADLLLLPSYNENYGNVVIESLSQGTPVLISDQVGLKDYVLENHFGWVNKCDIQQWRKLLSEIWEDRNTRDIIRVKAPKIIRHHFDSNLLVKQYMSMYEAVAQMQS